MLTPDFVGGPAAPALEQRDREPLGRQRMSRADLERAHQILERRGLLAAHFASFGRTEHVGIGRCLWLERRGRPSRERRLNLERHRVGRVRQGRIAERIACSTRFAGAREQHAHAHEQRRRLGATCRGHQRPERRGGERRLPECHEPTRQLLAQLRVIAEQEGTPGEPRCHVELSPTRGESARERCFGGALECPVAVRDLELGEQHRELRARPAAAGDGHAPRRTLEQERRRGARAVTTLPFGRRQRATRRGSLSVAGGSAIRR